MDLMVLICPLIATILLYFVLRVLHETVSYYWLTPRRIKKIMEQQGVRGPKPRFLVGNIPEISSYLSKTTSCDMDSINHDIVDRILPHYVSWSNSYGKRFVYWSGVEPRICLTETDLIQELLSKYSTLSGKSWQTQQGSKHFVGRGLLMANGNQWHHQRKIVAPAFIGDKLKSYAGYMVDCTTEMLDSLATSVKSGQTEFEISEYMARLTADIISRTEFGTNYEKGKQIFYLLTVLQRLSAQSSRRLFFPGSWFFPSKYNREIKSLKLEVDRLLLEIIHCHKDCVEPGRSKLYENDLLGMLLNAMQNGKRNQLNLKVIMDECKTFFFAGHDTTALLLTWTVMLLASNPMWQERVRAEIREFCGGNTPTIEQLSKLTLLNMVINESLRLYPPVSLIPRMAFEDIKLGDLLIPKGLSIWVPALAIHHDEQIWGKDVHEFNPERFATRSYAPGRHFIPFAAGPRNCVGQSFALMEAKIILAMMASKFRFTISKNYRHAPVVVITLKPKFGVQVLLTPLD